MTSPLHYVNVKGQKGARDKQVVIPYALDIAYGVQTTLKRVLYC